MFEHVYCPGVHPDTIVQVRCNDDACVVNVDLHTELVMRTSITGRQYLLFDPRDSVVLEYVRLPCLGSGHRLVLNCTDHGATAMHLHDSKLVPARSIAAYQPLLELPCRPVESIDVGSARSETCSIVSTVANQNDIAAQRHSLAEEPPRHSIRCDQFLLLNPRCPIETKDVGGSRTIVLACRNDSDVVLKSDTETELVPSSSIAGYELLFLDPRTPIESKDVGSPRIHPSCVIVERPDDRHVALDDYIETELIT